jgi:hypothetical protein
LNEAKAFRQRISPYQAQPQDFELLVRQFFTKLNPLDGFNTKVDGVPLGEKLDSIEKNLRFARDTYAHLATFADLARFKSDVSECSNIINDDNRCQFAARTREAVREAAYLRLIFGQQLTADSIGLFFGANVVGGESYISVELRKLHEGLRQFKMAQQTILDGMNVAIGANCHVFDFYTEREWLVLSRILEGLHRTQHQIAMREAQLTEGAVIKSISQFQTTVAEQYISLLSIAAIQARLKANPCKSGYQMQDDIIRRMVVNMLDVRDQSTAVSQGLNIFGYDPRLIPALMYSDLSARALNYVAVAKTDEGIVRAEKRAAEEDRALLDGKIDAVNQNLTSFLKTMTGCLDNDLVSCSATYPAKLKDCLLKANNNETFVSCLNAQGIASQRGDLYASAQRVVAAHLTISLAIQRLENIKTKQEYEKERKAKITDALYGSGTTTWEAVLDATIAGAGSLSSLVPSSPAQSARSPEFLPVLAIGLAVLGTAAAVGSSLRNNAMRGREINARVKIEEANSEFAVRSMLLEMHELEMQVGIAIQETNVAYAEFESLVNRVASMLSERNRVANYTLTKLADEPANRLIYDSLRLKYADSMLLAQQMVYLAMKRADYETAGKVFDGQCSAGRRITIAEVYRSRTSGDLETLLQCLDLITSSAKGDPNVTLKSDDIRVSVAQHLLGLTNENLAREGIQANQYEQERVKRFRLWVQKNTTTDQPPKLVFNFSTSIAQNGLFAQLKSNYQKYWLNQIAGNGNPRPENSAFRVRLISAQSGNLVYRDVTVVQGGVTHLRDETGCIREYRVVDPAIFVGISLGRENESTTFEAAVNGDPKPTYYTPQFNGRPVSASDWKIELQSGPPSTNFDVLDLQKLNDIELLISTTRRATDAQTPDPVICSR